jgi:RNA polymerase sigma factor (sigma-70 family)
MTTKNLHSQKPDRLSLVTATFLEHQSFLKKFLSRYLHNRQDIEDVVQETYLRAYQAELNKDIEQPKAFLFRIARNIALTSLTKKSNQITDYIADLDDSLVIDNGTTVENEVEARQNLGIYCEAVAALPEQCRRVFLLRKIHGLSHKEIAERMELSVSSVEKHLLKGVIRCRKFVREYEEGGHSVRCSNISQNIIKELG